MSIEGPNFIKAVNAQTGERLIVDFNSGATYKLQEGDENRGDRYVPTGEVIPAAPGSNEQDRDTVTLH